MNWLLHNPIGDMRGPDFLLLYIALSAGALVVAGLTLWTRFWTGTVAMRSNQPVPAELDPYELAWLRGGEAEVIRVAVLRLVHRNYLNYINDRIEPATPRPDPRHLSGIEEVVLRSVGSSGRPLALSEDPALLESVRNHCQPYIDRSAQEEWTVPEARRTFWRRLVTGLLVLLVLLAVYKLSVAVAKGRTNFGFLLMLLVVNVLLFSVIRHVMAVVRLTQRGLVYQGRVKSALAQLQDRASTITPNSSDATLALLAGAFGLGALQNTIYSAFASALHPPPPASSGTGWSGGCGSGCGSTSSCGGGGGGCGGGGCGGCGG